MKAGSSPVASGYEISVKGQRLDDLLILGLGWPGGAIKCDNPKRGSAALSDAAEKYFGVSKSAILPRNAVA